MKSVNIISLVIVLAAFAAGLVLYPQLPQNIASHWNLQGIADGYMSKFWGVFLSPVLLAVLFVFSLIIPRVDPLKANIVKFRLYYNSLWLVIFLFLVYIYTLTLAWNLGSEFNFTRAMLPAFAVFWAILGMLLKHSKRNWFVGIRTPWTLSSDIVWEKTHWLAGKLFEITTVFIFAGLWFPELLMWFTIVPITATILITVVYSYWVYRKWGKSNQDK